MKAEWTTEYPTQPGYYWIRGMQRDSAREPVVVEVDSNLNVRFAGSELLSPRAAALSAEWCGPIQPPEAQ